MRLNYSSRTSPYRLYLRSTILRTISHILCTIIMYYKIICTLYYNQLWAILVIIFQYCVNIDNYRHFVLETLHTMLSKTLAHKTNDVHLWSIDSLIKFRVLDVNPFEVVCVTVSKNQTVLDTHCVHAGAPWPGKLLCAGPCERWALPHCFGRVLKEQMNNTIK
jgi:hypothetical protein